MLFIPATPSDWAMEYYICLEQSASKAKTILLTYILGDVDILSPLFCTPIFVCFYPFFLFPVFIWPYFGAASSLYTVLLCPD